MPGNDVFVVYTHNWVEDSLDPNARFHAPSIGAAPPGRLHETVQIDYLSTAPVSPDSNSWRCAHSGAMPLVITCWWNSRRLNAAPRACPTSSRSRHRQLAQEVAAVGGVVGAAFGLLAGGRRRQVRAGREERGRVVDRPLAGVERMPATSRPDPSQRLARLEPSGSAGRRP
ncbi:MAG: hypothetical protein R2708_26850 [Vicinamibacterales bacterium]